MTLASNTIFHARLRTPRPMARGRLGQPQQAGCVRFCVLPFDSITPRRYRLPAA